MVAAQNTKGDKPIPNQKKIRESKFKSVKKRKKIKTRDISGRRLRTKNKSSASRANASWPQPDPYRDRKLSRTDKPARTTGRIFNKPPRAKSNRAWRGNISGHRLRVQTQQSHRARNNVFPQRGPFINNPSKEPRKKPKVYLRTASGSLPVKRVPQTKQRAWQGNIKGGKIGTPSRSGRVKNVYPQDSPFVNQSSKRQPPTRSNYRNSGKIAKAAKRENQKRPGRQWRLFPGSASGSFVQRSRKNVYWGKYSKGEKAYTGDITGRKLRTRNFRSVPAGLVNRDTIQFFGRKPGGDRAFTGRSGKYGSATISGRAWRGDISGKRIRNKNYASRKGEKAGKFVFPRKLSISKTGEVGKYMPGGGFKSRSKSGETRTGKGPLPARAPGVGASSLSKYQNKITGRRPLRGGGSVSGGMWNNKGTPINVRTGSRDAARAARFQGNFLRGELTPGFTKQGADYTGNIKARKPLKGGGSISGQLWNNKGAPIPVRTPKSDAAKAGKYQGNFKRGELQPGFSRQGADFSGNIKAKKPLKGGGSVSGRLWNNKETPIAVRTPPGEAIKAGRFQGTFRRGELQPGFTKQGADYTGNIKAKKPLKGGGSISGKIWNNDETPIAVRTPSSGAAKAVKFQGTFRRGELQPGFTKQGADYTGNIKAKKPLKGGGSISGKLWNNNETAIAVRTPASGAAKAVKFQGALKRSDVSPKRSKQGIDFAGNMKAKKPEHGGGSVSGILWNNKGEPIAVRTPKTDDAKAANYSGRIQSSRLRKSFVQNPNAVNESIKKHKPDKSTYEVAGLQVKVKRGDHQTKKQGAKGSLPGVAPKKSSIQASEYARGMKRNWNYKHNPKSADDALKVQSPGKATALAKNYQGNLKMYRYKDPKLHPDAKFAHSFDDNVKEERTILMNLRLFWAKLFKKSDTQPDHLKDKNRKPRYDKREQGMWYN
jgi:hypothetical protein